MAFDVDEAWEFLLRHGAVHTVRPASWYMARAPITSTAVGVHLHRGGKWTGHEATKVAVASGRGQAGLEQMMQQFLQTSGFGSVADWLAKLVSMHGRQLTTVHWIIYAVSGLKQHESVGAQAEGVDDAQEA